MACFSGYLNFGEMLGKEIGSYRIDDTYNYANRAAMVVGTMMRAGISLFNLAEAYKPGTTLRESNMSKACAIMNTLYAWKVRPEKVPADCAASWLDDAWCTLHQRYEKIQEEEEEK